MSLWSVSCQMGHDNTTRSITDQLKVSNRLEDAIEFEKPLGNEVALNIQKIALNRYSVAITNVSKRNVYMPFLPARDGSELVDYFPSVKERKNPVTGLFESYDSGGDFAPGLYPIESAKTIKFFFTAPERGIYRLRFSFLVDKKAAELINAYKLTDAKNPEVEKIADAYFQVVTPEMRW